jgi:predicted DNA-binding helix-hairpin-helix protein
MDPLLRLRMLTDQMSLEPDGEGLAGSTALQGEPLLARPGCFSPQRSLDDLFIHPAQSPRGPVRLLKTLLTSACERDCFYCPFRAGRNFRRATFKADEFAALFMQLHRARAADGIFLSSGIAGGGVRSQDRLLDTADILRHRFGFQGYLHLKIMPSVEKAQVERAMLLADRVSVNLEAPSPERLARLAPHKDFAEELIRPLRWVDEIRRSTPPTRAWNRRWPSTVTQFVAGGSDESDLELLNTTDWLHRNVGLKRAYFSAFHPIVDTPLENKPAVDPLRERRLYQASFLLRDYGFDVEELTFTPDGNLPLPTDPKLAWAQSNLADRPLEVNRADRRALLRVPGIGPRGVEGILMARRNGKLRDLSALRKLGVVSERAAPYLLLDGRRSDTQLPLF